jgi:hypothetical protein
MNVFGPLGLRSHYVIYQLGFGLDLDLDLDLLKWLSFF